MKNEDKAELILTPDGNLNNVAFIEEIIKAAPEIDNWVFTALKPELDLQDTAIHMHGYEFNKDNLFFYSNEHESYPDEIDITVVYTNWVENDKENIQTGVFIFLDNYLGEYNFITVIDEVNIVGESIKKPEFVPIGKLKEFLRWRQKEFVERYEDVIYNSEDDNHSVLEMNYKDGDMGIACINKDILSWESKASHPWMSLIEFNYPDDQYGGLPGEGTREELEKIEDELLEALRESEGCINVGRMTAKNKRTVYFTCKDFRKPATIFHNTQEKYKDHFEISFNIYKDKYWQTFNKFDVD